MLKFDFSVLTRDGQKVENIVISGQDQPDAERKLRQMYHHCKVYRCEIRQREMRYWQATSYEDILSLITK
mgnify:CR=1 FL=1